MGHCLPLPVRSGATLYFFGAVLPFGPECLHVRCVAGEAQSGRVHPGSGPTHRDQLGGHDAQRSADSVRLDDAGGKAVTFALFAHRAFRKSEQRKQS